MLIRGYVKNRITIGDRTYRSSLIISPHRIIEDWQPQSTGDLTEADFKLMLELDPELVLLGTGERLRFPHQSITQPLMRQSVGLEVMGTAAACRTYNVLAHEGRNVVASLIVDAGSIEES
jgi:uncharacterized protein